MTFIDPQRAAIIRQLKALHFDFPRAESLRQAFSDCVTDYYAKADIGRSFEARGLVIIGKSRLGKTQEVERLIQKFNASGTLMPDGRPARIVGCLLSAKDTWKELGLKTLHALGYPLESRRSPAYVWNLVREQARAQGVVGIAYDECQHVFTEDDGASNNKFRDSFKTLLKDPRWPLMLFLSGVPDLATQVARGPAGQQLAALLTSIEFDAMRLPRDAEQLHKLAWAFADQAGVDLAPVLSKDFYERLAYACANRWGLLIELLIDALVHCRLDGRSATKLDDFVRAYAARAGLNQELSPFTSSDYRAAFDPERLLKLIDATDPQT